jgi:alanyl-tRNA synthetase
MEKMGLNQLRELFLSFYEEKDHLRSQSFPLIPQNDKSLLIINSGMAPLKPYFAGTLTPPAPRMTTCQKCIRTADIENVGFTSRHGTFFEMLGSFSFGDYFKIESITWGWEFITQKLNLPIERLWASVYEQDDEAYDIWKDVIGMPEERIVKLGKDDNFWEIGVGPCGPCSEIYFDRGREYGCDKPDCKPGCDCDRYIEFWNHVFTQYSNDGNGNYSDLAHKNIDTGLGLERLACIMQDVDSIFAVDTIKYVLDAVSQISDVEYQNGQVDTDVSIRIITDHMRSATFMIGDKIMPSNEGRGYVLRRLIRRAARHGKKIGIEGLFLTEIISKVIDVTGEAYPELEEQRDFISKIVQKEEEKFSETLNQGLHLLDKAFESIKDNKKDGVLSGEIAFKLHDTYGLPYEITEEICHERGFTVDLEEFKRLMAHQKQAGQSDAATSDHAWKKTPESNDFQGETLFTGYDASQDTATVLGIYTEEGARKTAGEGMSCDIILDRTPFYAAGGGQAADKGIIENSGLRAEVVDVIKQNGVYVHRIIIHSGHLNLSDQVDCLVNVENRNATSRNHTGTHILQKALRMVLGEHVQQAGSAVNAESLRFDFSHYEAMTNDQINQVEQIINQQILMFHSVVTAEMSMADANKEGAIGLFEDKYGDSVRVVSVGQFSKELCGGIHVTNAGQIGAFHIISESGIAAGVRRIEAVTGDGILKILINKENIVDRTAELLKTNNDMILERLSFMAQELRETKKELDELKRQGMGSLSKTLLDEAKMVNGTRLIAKNFQNMDINDLRELSDQIKATEQNLALVFAAELDGKVTFLVSLTDDVVSKGYHAGKMIKEIAAAAGGGGGGKADMAQAGGKDPSKIHEALLIAEKLL